MDRETIDRILPDGWELQPCWDLVVSAKRGDLTVWFHADQTCHIQAYDDGGSHVPTYLTMERLAEIPQVVAALRIARDVLPAQPLLSEPEVTA